MASIGGKDLGNITDESSTKTSGLFNTPMPFSDSDEALIMDLMGVTRTITINGNKSGTTAELKTFITDIEGLQNGEQSALTFVSSWADYSGKTFLIQDFAHIKVGADENRVNYTLTIVEGSVL